MERINVNGKRFIDEHGRQRIFNGMNFADKSGLKYCSINPNEYTEINLRKLSEYGFNVIRLGVTWEAIETEPGKYNEDYIDKIVKFMDVCHKYGMYVFIDMHQDLYGPVAGCWGDGAPEWASLTDGAKRKKNKLVWATGYFWGKPVHNCFDNFWADKEVNGIGLQTYFINMWKHIAERVKDHPALFGFDLFNEPFPGSDGGKIFRTLIMSLAKTIITDKRCPKMKMLKCLLKKDMPGVLEPFEDPDLFRKVTRAGLPLEKKFDEGVYADFINRLSKGIRDVTDNGIIIVESCYYTNISIPFSMPAVNYDGKREEKLCYSPHGYDLMVDTPAYEFASNSRVQAIFDEKKNTQDAWDSPVLVGEWGGYGDTERMLRHIDFLLDYFDKNQWSQAYYTFFMSMTYYELPILEHLSRPFPIAVCGTIEKYRHDRENNSFTLEFYQEKEFDVPTVIFAHKEIGSIETDGEYKVIPLGETGRSNIEIKTGIGSHKVTVKFK
ncbi:MAG: cellulase family glycosylhydrolase [Clostridia bacterium]|nr:cellulase family glycosylhydrolase [Clostridia bacterium]